MRRVLIIWAHPLFHKAVCLLLSHPTVEIVGATSEHATSQTLINALKPDVVIIEESEAGEFNLEETISILQKTPRVIRIGLANNELSIYQRQKRTITKAEDLLRLILEGGPEDQT